jgi:hypothetical protein
MYSMPLRMITFVHELEKVYDILWFIPTIKQTKHDKTEISLSYNFIFIVVESGFVIVLCVFPVSATLLISSYFLIFLLLSNHTCSNLHLTLTITIFLVTISCFDCWSLTLDCSESAITRACPCLYACYTGAWAVVPWFPTVPMSFCSINNTITLSMILLKF